MASYSVGCNMMMSFFFCLNTEVAPEPTGQLKAQLALCPVSCSFHSLNTALFYSPERRIGIILYFSCPNHCVSHFSKACWFQFNGMRNSEVKLWTSSRLMLLGCSCSPQALGGKNWGCVYIHTYTYNYIYEWLCIFSIWSTLYIHSYIRNITCAYM